MRINPFFELNGNRYELKRTRWLVAEYNRLNEEEPLGAQDKENAITASNLVADAQKFAAKEKECWEELCKNPTEDNQRIYLLFKGMSDNAIAKYNEFVSSSDAIRVAANRNAKILERVAIKALAEQYFAMNENLAKQTWEMFAETFDSHDDIAEWLHAMAECLFVEEDEEENNDFLSQMKKKRAEQEANRKNASTKKR